MKRINKTFLLSSAIILPLLVASCSGKNAKKEEIQKERDAFEASMGDSIKALEAELKGIHDTIPILMERADEMLSSFRKVDNPREVEPYYIMTSASYPLQQTGLTARMMASEKFELVAALSSGNFDRIRVSTAGGSVDSDVVPHDQALNYRRQGLTTVSFTGNAADSIGMLIANAPADAPVTVTFLNPGQTGRLTLSPQQRAIVAGTWNLCNTRKLIKIKERSINVISRKIQILSAHLEEINDTTR